MKSTGRSREGRHTAKLSTWMMRYGLINSRDKALRLIRQGKVFVNGETGKINCSYTRLDKNSIFLKGE